MRELWRAAGSALLALFFSTAAVPARAQDFKAILDNPERPASERALDAARKPDEVLKFYGVKAGDKAADVMTGKGYYAALLSQAVGPKGLVYAANPKVSPELAARFKNPLYANVKLVEGKMEAVALPQDGSLDCVIIDLNYHDLDPAVRTAMDKRIFAALKASGVYGIVDHAAKDGVGNEVAHTLHRIDKALVVKEVSGAGFILAGEGEMLRHPEDPRTQVVFKMRGQDDRFVLKFEKPRG